jgi:hypothetical protein
MLCISKSSLVHALDFTYGSWPASRTISVRRGREASKEYKRVYLGKGAQILFTEREFNISLILTIRLFQEEIRIIREIYVFGARSLL